MEKPKRQTRKSNQVRLASVPGVNLKVLKYAHLRNKTKAAKMWLSSPKQNTVKLLPLKK